MREPHENKFFVKANFVPLILSATVISMMIVLLVWQGRIWWCKSGDYAIYINEAWNSSHTSQHLFDPYTFTHILHGIAFFWLAKLIFSCWSVGWRLFAAITAESAWEVLENTNAVIEKYRENTASLDYFGDSIFNSIGDVAACAAGFLIAYKLGWRRALIFFVLTEFFLLLWIRDSLLLNVIMLLHPFDSIKTWQMNA